MNPLEGKNLFQLSNRDIMQDPRLLIIDHDVTRYHSFDMIRYILYKARHNNDQEFFKSLQNKYWFLIDGKHNLDQQIKLMRCECENFNVFNCFDIKRNEYNQIEYLHEVCKMSQEATGITATGAATRLDMFVYRRNVTTVLLQYKGEKYHPRYYDKTIAYEVENPLDLNVIYKLVTRHNINAIMVSSSKAAIDIAIVLAKAKVTKTKRISMLVGRYAYNFYNEDNKMIYPLYMDEMETLSVRFKFEFGIYDPFAHMQN